MKGIEQIMRHDHERLVALLETGARAVREGRWIEAAKFLERFRHDLVDGHMMVEETILFPAFEAQAGHGDLPLTALLRKGHRELHVFFMEMEEAIGAQDTEEYNALLSAVQAILKHHDAKEEEELYPFVAEALPDQGQLAGQTILGQQGTSPVLLESSQNSTSDGIHIG